MSLVYVFGAPGVGKSTACTTALAPYLPVPQPDALCPHRAYYTNDGRLAALQLGLDHPTHPGTDRLSMSIMPRACQWITTINPSIPILGEGDRLAHPRFWQTATQAGHPLTLIHLWTDPHTHATRTSHRTQHPTWTRGRTTRTNNLANQHHHNRIQADQDAPTRIAALLQLPPP